VKGGAGGLYAAWWPGVESVLRLERLWLPRVLPSVALRILASQCGLVFPDAPYFPQRETKDEVRKSALRNLAQPTGRVTEGAHGLSR